MTIAGVLATLAAPLAAQVVHPIDMSKLSNASQFEFLAPMIDGVEIVSLGESIHLTSEFPLVRIGMIRYLNERSGFQMLGMEGSAEDIWVAQDRLLASTRTDADLNAALLGLFSIWNTNDVRELLAYEVASWSAPHPFYVAAYDIQPGTSKGAPDEQVFHQLFDRLGRYADAPASVDEAGLVADLAPLTAACNKYVRDDSARVERGIANLAQWTERAAPAVDAQFKNVPHAAVLRLIPENLRASHRVSVGQILHRDFGPRLYTIMPFAEGGIAPLIYSDVNDDIAYGRVHGATRPLGDRLSRLSTSDYFLDLRSVATDSQFTTPQAVAVEASTMRLALAKDFDGIVWIKRVHPPHFTTGAMTGMLIGLSVMHYRVGVLVAVSTVLALILLSVIVRRRHARRLTESLR